MKNAGKARSYGLYRHLRTSKEIIENLLNYYANIKSVVVINFVLDVILCAVSVILNIKLFSTKYKTPIVGKIGLLSATLCFGLFTYFAFLMPQNGLPAALFS